MPNWDKMAMGYAEFAYQDYSIRWQTVALTDPAEHVVLLNNMHARCKPLLRDRQQAELSRRLAMIGVATLASATAPVTGPAEGISSAMVFDAPRSLRERVEREWLEVYGKIGWEG